MIAYHVDRQSSLRPGATVCGFVDENYYSLPVLSMWGKTVKNSLLSPDFNLLNTYNIEIHTESVRKAYFPSMLSRFSSFFAVPSLDDFSAWKDILGPLDECTIYEVSFFGRYHLLDASFLNQNLFFVQESEDPLEHYSELAASRNALHDYWNGVFSENPLPELLIELPVYINKIVT